MKELGKKGDFAAYLDTYKDQKYELRISDTEIKTGTSAASARERAHTFIAKECAGKAPPVVLLANGKATRGETPRGSPEH